MDFLLPLWINSSHEWAIYCIDVLAALVMGNNNIVMAIPTGVMDGK